MALCDFREYHVERVHNAVEVVAKKVRTEHQKLAPKKEMCEVDLQQEIGEIEPFAENHFARPVAIHSDVRHESRLNSLELKLDTFCRVNQHVGKPFVATCYLLLKRRPRENYVGFVDLQILVSWNEFR